MDKLGSTVGVGCHNGHDDVMLVQTLLTRHSRWTGPSGPPTPTGTFDPCTDRAIRAFQLGGAALAKADGIVSPSSYTFKALSLPSIPGPQHRVFLPVCWAHGGGLTDDDFAAAAKTLGCEVAMIRAVAQVETKRSPWDENGRPTILFEHAKFSHGNLHKTKPGHPQPKGTWRATDRVYDLTHPDISGHGPYGKFAAQYSRLTRAATLNEIEALKSASYGTFQLMGFNHVACGYADVASFVDAMLESEGKHLAAFVAFILADSHLQTALKNKQWAAFAKIYNGPDYLTNQYDTKMASAYAALTGKP